MALFNGLDKSRNLKELTEPLFNGGPTPKTPAVRQAEARANLGLGTGNAAATALVALTDSTGGTPSNTVVDVPASYTEATLANQLASIIAKVNALIAIVKA